MTENRNHEEMSAFFNARATGYDNHMHASLADAKTYYRKLAESVPRTSAPIKILDLGCGTGLEIPAIFEKAPNARLTCIDLSAEMLQILRKKFPKDNIQIIEGSYLAHELGKGVYEVILSSMTLHHLLPDQKRILYQNLYTALKNDGVYIEGDYIVPEEKMNCLLEAYKALPEESKGGSHHIDIPLSLAVQIKLLRQAGFMDIQKVYACGENVILSAKKNNRTSDAAF